jgi:hypothetical protein
MKARDQYVNGLNHDINYFEQELKIVREGRRVRLKFFVWWLGDRIPRYQVKAMIIELKEELQKVLIDKTYKPWK